MRISVPIANVGLTLFSHCVIQWVHSRKSSSKNLSLRGSLPVLCLQAEKTEKRQMNSSEGGTRKLHTGPGRTLPSSLCVHSSIDTFTCKRRWEQASGRHFEFPQSLSPITQTQLGYGNKTKKKQQGTTNHLLSIGQPSSGLSNNAKKNIPS